MYPPDVLLPLSSKYFGFIDSKYAYDSNWDITWSFSFSLSGQQHAFCSFLTTNPILSSGIPGQYLGFLGDVEYMLSESGEILMDEYGNKILRDSSALSGQDLNGVLAIAFDSTGYFALSSSTAKGVGMGGVKPNSLIIRDSNTDVIFNESLSTLDTSFILASSIKVDQTLRFRYANGGKKIYVDYKKPLEKYKNLATVTIPSFSVDSNRILYPGFTFCSPISSNSISPSTIRIKNFHTQGNTNEPTYEVINCVSLNPNLSTSFVTIAGVSAIPI